ncbi:hypothetical protein FJY71_00815, partial [candidate division WOR-3 bacterium]|nr:hypothetical protein [candidate division WOR-3 bacterium]
MKRLPTVLFTLVLAAGTGLGQRWVPLETGRPEQPARFEVQSSNLSSTVVELTLSGLYVTDVQERGRTFQQLELGIAAGGLLTETGAPQLPVVGRLVAIPDAKGVRVDILEQEEVTLPGYRVYPAQPPLPDDESSQPFVIDEARYAKDELYPDAGARTGEPMIMRDFRVVQLVLQPVRFNPVTGELRVTRRLKLALRYEG